MRATRAIIHLGNLQSNIAAIRRNLSPGTRLCIPVKADAYGHGATRVAVAAIRAGATHLAVASAQEGIDLREAGIVSPILSLSLPIPEEIPSIVENDLSPLVVDLEFIEELASVAKTMGKIVQVHLKIDTGMNRIGCSPENSLELAKVIAKHRNLELAGTATHLSVADSVAPDDVDYTRAQLARFDAALETFRKAGIDPGIVHAANSGAIAQFPESHYDMVRPGILVYGYPPSAELADRIPVQPVMELESRVVAMKKIEAGSSVSYGRTWTAAEDTWIGTLPVGYADGLARKLSPGLRVRIGDGLYPIVGRICMDQCMVDLGPDPWVQRWDRAVIFGPMDSPNEDRKGAVSGTPTPSAETLAEILGTIPYEITCGINKRVPRVYDGENAR